MISQLTEALKRVHELLQQEMPPYCTGVNIFFNAHGYELECRTRTPESLERDCISMRNIRGEWIKREAAE